METNGGKTMKKTFLILFLSFMLLFSFVFLLLDGILDMGSPSDSRVNSYGNEVVNSGNSNNITIEEVSDPKYDNIIFLLCGVDSNDITDSTARTDTMMLITINIEEGNVSILSIPRDTMVEINNRVLKINSAHAIGGMPLTVSAVNDLLGINVEYFVKVDYKVVIELVDIIGGVEVDVPFLMEYKDPTSDPPLDIYIKKGNQVLDGKNSYDFLRWRKNNDETIGYREGDIGRINTQQYFLKELILQTLKPKNLLKLPSIIGTYINNVDTNIPITSMLSIERSANKINMENIITETLPGKGEYVGSISYYLMDKEKTNELLDAFFE